MASAMATRRQNRTGALSASASYANARDAPTPEKKRLDGVWQDDQWWCNCEPRNKAALREVKKEGPNKGKFFWTCATYPYCSFFLWRDDALIRESGPATASDIEVGQIDQSVPARPKTPSFTQKPLESYGIESTPSRRPMPNAADETVQQGTPGASSTSTRTVRESHAPTSIANPSTPSSKRKRHGDKEWGQDDFSDLDSEEERQLADIVDRSAQKVAPQRTPDDVFAAPTTDGRTFHIVGGLPTPSVSRTLFPTSEAKRSKTVSFEESLSSDPLTTPSKTPTSASSFSPACSSTIPHDQDVTEQVMELLKGQAIDPAVLQSVHGLLLTSARRAKGIALGRESARAALKDKDKKIAQLQGRILDLENQDAYNRKRMINMKSGIIRLYEDN